MFKSLEPNTYRPIYILDQLLLLREMAVVHQLWGIRGIYFVTLYGWVGSPYIDEEEKLREENVLKYLENPLWYSSTDPLTKPVKEKIKLGGYHSDIKRAIERANEKFKVPELEDYDYYGSRIGKMREAASRLVYDSKKPAEIQKAAATESGLNKNTKELRLYQAEAEALILAKRGKRLHVSLNNFIEAIQQ